MYTVCYYCNNKFNSPGTILGFVCEIFSLIWEGFMTKLHETRQQGILPSNSNTSDQKCIQFGIFPSRIFSQYASLPASAGPWNGRGDSQHNWHLQTDCHRWKWHKDRHKILCIYENLTKSSLWKLVFLMSKLNLPLCSQSLFSLYPLWTWNTDFLLSCATTLNVIENGYHTFPCSFPFCRSIH